MLGCNAGAVRAVGHCSTHHGFSGFAHHGAHVFKVNVQQAWHIDDFGDTADGVLQHVIGMGEGFVLPDVIAQNFEQFLVQNDDQGVNVGFEFGQTGICIVHAASAFEVERLGHHTHSEDAHFFGDTCDHGGSARSGATTHTGGDEEHVRTFDRATDIRLSQFGGFAAFVGFAACAQAGATELDNFVGRAAAQSLGIGIGTDEFNAAHGGGNHVLDGIAAAATHANDLDLGALVERFFFNHLDGHAVLLKKN